MKFVDYMDRFSGVSGTFIPMMRNCFFVLKRNPHCCRPKINDPEKISEQVKDMKELKIEAAVKNIGVVTDFVNAELERLNCSPKASTQIAIAIDELFGNIARYAYDPDVGNAEVRLEVQEEPLSVIITFIDNGKPFNPLEQAQPDTTASAKERKIGGLGIFLVKKTMDMVEYEYKEGQNILKIKKICHKIT